VPVREESVGERVDLYMGDSLGVLRALPEGSVSHVVTDPPYGQTNEAYDGPIAFDPSLWAECYRVARPGAVLLSFAGSPTYHRIASAIEAGGWKVRQMWGWVYRNGFITSAYPQEGFDRLAPAFDPIVHATKGKALLRVEREPGETWHRARNEDEVCTWSGRSGRVAPTANGRWPRSLVAEPGCPGFEYFALNPNSPSLRAEKTGHPNQKPLALMRWLVSKLSAGGVILDPFTGSGTTGVAAVMEGFGFIGIEREPGYVDIARRRLAEVESAHPLFPEVASAG
jgi:adenine-specific DNA-methyltransferase